MSSFIALVFMVFFLFICCLVYLSVGTAINEYLFPDPERNYGWQGQRTPDPLVVLFWPFLIVGYAVGLLVGIAVLFVISMIPVVVFFFKLIFYPCLIKRDYR